MSPVVHRRRRFRGEFQRNTYYQIFTLIFPAGAISARNTELAIDGNEIFTLNSAGGSGGEKGPRSRIARDEVQMNTTIAGSTCQGSNAVIVCDKNTTEHGSMEIAKFRH